MFMLMTVVAMAMAFEMLAEQVFAVVVSVGRADHGVHMIASGNRFQFELGQGAHFEYYPSVASIPAVCRRTATFTRVTLGGTDL
jgi:hypothetical protein